MAFMCASSFSVAAVILLASSTIREGEEADCFSGAGAAAAAFLAAPLVSPSLLVRSEEDSAENERRLAFFASESMLLGAEEELEWKRELNLILPILTVVMERCWG